ncbi:MAG: RNA polymerase sigma factor region1.1 domain-containing protein, partial [Anaerolineae bacterium]|nr:RNA polymerase sigma factor region1.1 domain-containing protein [Anaerolineae bacterium]
MVQTIQKGQLRAQLIAKASKQGFITYNDILAVLPDVEKDADLLEDIMFELVEANINVVAGGTTPEDNAIVEPLLEDAEEDTGVEIGIEDEDEDIMSNDLSFAS